MARDPLILNMTPEQYKAARKPHGTQSVVADLLEVTRETIVKRESGAMKITREASLAIQALPVKKPKETK